MDDRSPKKNWYKIKEKPDVIIFEGWCVGAKAEGNKTLKKFINSLEKANDQKLIWRQYVNQQLKTKYKKSEYYYFDSYTVVLDPDFSSLKGKWVNILINAKWSKKGFLHFWIDGKLRTSYFGDTMVGASSARFKFGPYRHHMDEATDVGLKIPDTVIRYSCLK